MSQSCLISASQNSVKLVWQHRQHRENDSKASVFIHCKMLSACLLNRVWLENKSGVNKIAEWFAAATPACNPSRIDVSCFVVHEAVQGRIL
jgi:hypothetical protein